jgi:aspartate/methionine/tyrosine aminotransferase
MFSKLVHSFCVPKNELYEELDRRRRAQEPVSDLISGNVNDHGINFPQDIYLKAVEEAVRKSQIYRPDPFGLREAREAIAGFYEGEGVPAPAETILITPGTSLSYSYAFMTLADHGDEILVPQPSYPLFDSIAAMCGVILKPYRFVCGERWMIDLGHLESQIGPKTKAIILISPHNPTGAVATGNEIEGLAEIARKHDLPIISDEVFSPFVFSGEPLPRPAQTGAPLIFTLNGFSKMFALPGFKLGWIAISGDADKMKTAINALEHISDSFLPVSDISQCAAKAIFRDSKEFLMRYRQEIRKRRDVAMQVMRSQGAEFVQPEGGFHVSFQVKCVDSESAAVQLLRKKGILIHPGFFYDLPEGYFVTATVSEEAVLREKLYEAVKFLKGN